MRWLWRYIRWRIGWLPTCEYLHPGQPHYLWEREHPDEVPR